MSINSVTNDHIKETNLLMVHILQLSDLAKKEMI